MSKELLEELWKETDKKLYDQLMELRLNYQIGSIKKKEYDIRFSYYQGIYDGWRDLYKTLKEKIK